MKVFGPLRRQTFLFFCWLVGVTVCSYAYDWSGNPGTGEPDTPYLIRTAEQLNTIGQTQDIHTACFRLTADIDLSGYDGTNGRPAFTQISTFYGDLDGDSHVISGYTFSTAGASGSSHGMIGLLRGRVRNLHLRGVSISAPENVNDLGAITGVNKGQVCNCSVSGIVAGAAAPFEGNVGMLVGTNAYSGVLVGCTVEVTMNFTGYLVQVGGLAGLNQGLIAFCSANGTITSENHFSGLGGLVGNQTAGGISRSFARVSLFAPEPGTTGIGGLVGVASSNQGPSWIFHCYSASSLAVGANAQQVAGFCGLASGDLDIVGCFWDESIPGAGGAGIGGNFPIDPGVLQGLPTSQLQSREPFRAANWDFTEEDANGRLDIWGIPDPADYPVLLWEKPTFSGGSGTEVDPYQLSTAQDIFDLGKDALWRDSLRLINDIDLSNYTFPSAVVGPDLIPDNGVYNGFGASVKFDGNGFTIDGLSIDTGGHEFRYVGLFSQGVDARNLGVTGAVINAADSYYVGILAGAGRAEECFATGTITATAGASCIGGIVGDGDAGSPSCLDCYAHADLLCAPQTSLVGGVAGTGWVTHCYSVGTIVGQSRGIVGAGANVFASFWDIDRAGSVNDPGPGGRTTAEMLDRQLYLNAGWDLAGESMNGSEDIWYVPDKSYPLFVRWVHCPDLAGMELPTAQAAIAASDLTVGTVLYEYDQFVPVDQIVTQDPGAGILVVPGTPVNLLVSLGPPYSGGHGTADDPYQMARPEDLDLLSRRPVDVDKHYIQTADIDMVGYSYDKALVSPDFNADGTYDGQQFTGVYDGGGFAIRHLCIDLGESSLGWLGMFGRLSDGAEIRDVHLTGLVISAGQFSDVMGGVCAENYGMVRNCSVTGTLTGFRSSQIGALIGRNYGTIYRCQADATVSGRSYIGGLTGYNRGGSIRHSQSIAHVVGDENAEAIGGIAGCNEAVIEYCHSNVAGEGDFNPTYFSGARWIGGVAGKNEGSIFRSSASGSLYGADFYTNAIGGLIGYAKHGEIVECFSTVTVTTGDLASNAGGLVGRNEGLVRDCYATGDVIGGFESLRFGGLIGLNHGTLQQCYTLGIPNAHHNNGGLVGNNQGVANACFWDTDTSGIDTAAGINSTSLAGMTGHPTPMMQTRSTFENAGWNLDYIWTLDHDGEHYPKLAWEFGGWDEQRFSLALNAGWNLISLPFDPVYTNVRDCFRFVSPERGTPSLVGNVWQWDAVHQAYLSVHTVQGECGYWIYLTEPTSLTVEGTPNDLPMTLEPGWNLIGSDDRVPVPSHGDIRDSWWWWDAEPGIYQRARTDLPSPDNELIPGRGYWLQAGSRLLLHRGTAIQIHPAQQ